MPCPPTDHFTAKLSVRKSEGPVFVSTNFTFFDCNTYSSCTECVSSPFPCDWCVDGHRCTHDSAENCRNDVLVNGVNVSHYGHSLCDVIVLFISNIYDCRYYFPSPLSIFPLSFLYHIICSVSLPEISCIFYQSGMRMTFTFLLNSC